MAREVEEDSKFVFVRAAVNWALAMSVFRQDTQTVAGESVALSLGKISYEIDSLVMLTENRPVIETQGNTLWLLLLNP